MRGSGDTCSFWACRKAVVQVMKQGGSVITNNGLNVFRISSPRHCPSIARVHSKNKADICVWVRTLSQNSQNLNEIQGQKILTAEAEFGSSLISSFIRSWTLSCSFSMAKTCTFLSNCGHIVRSDFKGLLQEKKGLFSTIIKL